MYILAAVQSDWLDLSGFLGWVIVTIYNTGVVAWRGVSNSVVIQMKALVFQVGYCWGYCWD